LLLLLSTARPQQVRFSYNNNTIVVGQTFDGPTQQKEVERIWVVFPQLLAVTSTQRQSFSSGLCLYSPKWKMIGPSISSTYNSRRNLKRQFFTFGIGKIIFLFEMFSLFKNELTFVVCIIISKQFSYLLSCGGVDFCGRALQKRNKVVRHAGPC
jgi:hypothetical protein